MVGSHVRLIQLTLFIVHPGKRTATCVVHERLRLPVDSITPLPEEDVAEVDEGKFRKAENRCDLPVGVVHPCGGPAEFETEPEQNCTVLWIEPDAQGPSSAR